MPSPIPFSESDLVYLAHAPELLVAVDFDGTFANFSDSPTDVRAEPGAIAALQRLARCSGVSVAIISGRHLAQLSSVTELPAISQPQSDDIRLVGSHGAEPAEQPRSTGEDPAAVERQEALASLGKTAENLAEKHPGMWVEYKPFSVGLHTRMVQDKQTAAAAEDQLITASGKLPAELAVTRGRDILEFSTATATKGTYLRDLIDTLSETTGTRPAVLFAGDDVTDETALAVLDQGGETQGQRVARPDIGIHVGGRLLNTTAAARKVDSPAAMAELLQLLMRARLGN